MPVRLIWFVLAMPCLLLLCVPASATPAAHGLQIGMRILAACPGDTDTPGHTPAPCAPARQRSDAPHPVPAQVTALSPPTDPAPTGTPPVATVTY